MTANNSILLITLQYCICNINCVFLFSSKHITGRYFAINLTLCRHVIESFVHVTWGPFKLLYCVIQLFHILYMENKLQ